MIIILLNLIGICTTLPLIYLFLFYSIIIVDGVTQNIRPPSQRVLCQCGNWWSQNHSRQHNRKSWPPWEISAWYLCRSHLRNFGAPIVQALACLILFLGWLCFFCCSFHFGVPGDGQKQQDCCFSYKQNVKTLERKNKINCGICELTEDLMLYQNTHNSNIYVLRLFLLHY